MAYLNREGIDKFLQENKKKLINCEYLFGIDNNQNSIKNWDTAKMRVLVQFISTGKTRSVSNTYNAIEFNIKKLLGDDVFVDYSYFPEEENIELLQKNNVPFMFGNVSHAPASDYDLVLISHSIVPECINIPRVLKNSGIPLTTQQRLEDKSLPLIGYGGAAANESSIVLGPIYENGECIGNSLIDFAQYGYAEGCMSEYMQDIFNWIQEGNNPREQKVELMEYLIDNKIQYGKLFYPKYYKWNYAEDRFTIESIERLDDRLPEKVDYNKIKKDIIDDNVLGWRNKCFNLDGENASSVDIPLSSGCSGQSSVCSFCMEATVAAGYHEIPLNTMEENMKWMKANCAPNSSSCYSYNLNYYSDFMNLLKLQAENFSSISLLNERLDVVAHSPEQLALAKKLGLKRFSGAVEGFGTRIRNGILNKNLDRPTLMQATRVVMSLKLMMFKFGMILTGQETDADIDEFISEVDEMQAIRDELGATTAMQINVTPLVFYSQIALRYLPRITAENSFNEVRNMMRFITAMQERKVRTKING